VVTIQLVEKPEVLLGVGERERLAAVSREDGDNLERPMGLPEGINRSC
jgi:hypothetical protein